MPLPVTSNGMVATVAPHVVQPTVKIPPISFPTELVIVGICDDVAPQSDVAFPLVQITMSDRTPVRDDMAAAAAA